MTEIQRNNPLHGVKLEALLTDLVEHYGWEELASAVNINCFKSNPSITSSLKFLRKTDWAREKVEAIYLHCYKGLPRPNDEQFELPPRDRTISLDQEPDGPKPIKMGFSGGRGKDGGRSKPKSSRGAAAYAKSTPRDSEKPAANPWDNCKKPT